MRIIIDSRHVNNHFPGIGRYVYSLLRALTELPSPHRFVVLFHPDLPNTRFDMAALARNQALRLVPVRARPFSLAEQYVIPRLLRTSQADLYHAPYYVRPYVGLPCPSVVTLYDAIPHLFPAESDWRARLLFDTLTRLAIRASDRILAISASARDDLAAAYGIDPDRMAITPLAADERFRPQPQAAIDAVRERYDLPERYVLSLCSNKPHKNLVNLVTAFGILEASDLRLESEEQSHVSNPQPSASAASLVIAGHWDPRYPEAREAARRLRIEHLVRFLGDVAEEDLPALYAGAEVFAFPSRYEGFGLPPLEAMSCGVPVLCCDTSSMPEVVGEAALRVAPTSEALATGLSQLLKDTKLRATLRSAGLRQAARFSWQNTALATLAAYAQVAAGTMDE
jgi:alpha-1,3-rhamnosyl/mannosyltransferase